MNIDFNTLNEYDLDAVPDNLFQRDILKKKNIGETLKRNVLSSKPVTDITDLQLDDGSWGCFHTRSGGTGKQPSTENAVRRLLMLGLDKNDEPVKKVYAYMERFLNKRIDIPELSKGSFSDWKDLGELFAAAWLLEIDGNCASAGKIADKWARLVTMSFPGKTFDHDEYVKAFTEIFGTQAEKRRVWRIESFHVLSVVRNRLDPETEEKFIDYIINNEKGIYYITSGRKPLSLVPAEFKSRETVRFIHAHMLLSRFASYRKKNNDVVSWLADNREADGLWDFGPGAKDNAFLPYSASWKKTVNRRTDSTLLVQRYLAGAG